MNEQLKILEMIEQGQITAVEGMELMDALKASGSSSGPQKTDILPAGNKRAYKFLKIKVTSDNKTVNVNINVPIRLLATVGEIAGKVSSFVPKDARKKMESEGIDLSEIDFGRIIEEILSGTLDDPNIVDVSAWDDEHNSMIYVKVYVE